MINKNTSYDGEITISIGKSRKDNRYNVRKVKWSKFLQRVSCTKYTILMKAPLKLQDLCTFHLQA